MSHSPTNAPKDRTRSSSKVLLAIVLFLCLLGLSVSIELTITHYMSHTDPQYHAVCDINETMSCTTVAQSPYSVFAGIPTSVWGIIGYSLIALLAISGLVKRLRLHPHWPSGVLFSLFLVSIVTSATLGYISFTKIDSLCIFCLSTYVINALLFLLGGTILIKAGQNPLSALVNDIKSAFSKPKMMSALVIPGAAFIVGLVLLYPPYWQHPGWRELPKLPTGIDENGHHWIGAKNPQVTIVEYSDYQCPYCRRAHKNTRLLAAQYPDTVRVIHRHMPLDMNCNKDLTQTFHEHACEFSKAVECAAKQGMFWQMNDALFSVQDLVPPDKVNLERLAVQLGVDRSAFKDCMAQEGYPKRIFDDLEDSRRLKIQGTPTYFVGNLRMEGGISKRAIEEALAESKAQETQ